MLRVLAVGALIALSALAVFSALSTARPPALDGPPDTVPNAPQRPAPPEPVKAIYFTSWSAATPERLQRALALIDQTELNAIVIDVKDYSGKVAFLTGSPVVAEIGSEVRRIDLATLIRRFHERGAYIIVRIAAFQDHHLATVRPDLAVRDPAGRVWRDRQGLSWVDPAAREVWEYLAAVGMAAVEAGANELNFDYVRFPSDGDLDGLQYPFFDERHTSRRRVITEFFEYLTGRLRPTGAVLSADLFGMVTVAGNDQGIGQILEDALLYFDYVAPMVYPSHFARGFLDFKSPAAHPYDVVHYSLTRAAERRAQYGRLLDSFVGGTSCTGTSLGDRDVPCLSLARIRPWLQAFNLGAPYPPSVIREEIRAVYDVGLPHGWYLWSSSNEYDERTFMKP